VVDCNPYATTLPIGQYARVEDRLRDAIRQTQEMTPRPEPNDPADELCMLVGWLNHLRQSASHKLDGLNDEQLRWRPAPTANCVGGIVQHLAYGERYMFRVVFAGENVPFDFASDGAASVSELGPAATAKSVQEFYARETALADTAIAGASLDSWSRADYLGSPTTLRWLVTHMIEETARHAGHLDITRELIDGSTGR
jgi:hypothetical protein